MLFEYFESKRREMERRVMLENAGRVAMGAAFGAAVGGIVGVLFAPKSGEETRKDITVKAEEVRSTVHDKALELSGSAKELADRIKTNVANKMDKAQVKVEELEEEIEE